MCSVSSEDLVLQSVEKIMNTRSTTITHLSILDFRLFWKRHTFNGVGGSNQTWYIGNKLLKTYMLLEFGVQRSHKGLVGVVKTTTRTLWKTLLNLPSQFKLENSQTGKGSEKQKIPGIWENTLRLRRHQMVLQRLQISSDLYTSTYKLVMWSYYTKAGVPFSMYN